MMNALEKLAARQHLAVALLSTWLITTSPWIAMLRRVPPEAGFLDYSHVGLGFVTLAIAITYTIQLHSRRPLAAVFSVARRATRCSRT